MQTKKSNKKANQKNKQIKAYFPVNGNQDSESWSDNGHGNDLAIRSEGGG